MAGSSILVLGGRGFVGRAIVALLSQRHQLTVLTRSNNYNASEISIISGDLNHQHQLEIDDFDVIINASGEVRDRNKMHGLHVTSPLEMLNRWVPNRKRRWIQISSVGVYGKVRRGVIDETHRFGPLGEYEVTKAEGELKLKAVGESKGIGVVSLRPSNVFGDDMPNDSLRQLVRTVASGRFFYMKRPQCVQMNYLHVSSLARAVELVVDMAPQDGAYNVNSRVSMADLVDVVKSVRNADLRFPFVPAQVVRPAARALAKLRPHSLTETRIDALTGEALYSSEKLKQAIGEFEKFDVKTHLASFARKVLL